MSTAKFLTEVVDDRIWLMTINRPEVHNCVDGETAEAFEKALERFRDDESLDVAILTGAGEKSFCSGADLKAGHELAQRQGLSAQARRKAIHSGKGFMGYTRQTDIFKPIIAAVNGYAFAGGLELACLCDFRIVSRSAEFGVLCRRWNVPLVDGGTVRLPLIVGMGNALKLIITGERISAEEAYRIHLANELVEPGRAMERALEIARQLLALPQGAMRTDKQSVIEGVGHTMEERLRIEAACGETVLFGQDIQEGMRAFAEKRKGRFGAEA